MVNSFCQSCDSMSFFFRVWLQFWNVLWPYHNPWFQQGWCDKIGLHPVDASWPSVPTNAAVSSCVCDIAHQTFPESGSFKGLHWPGSAQADEVSVACGALIAGSAAQTNTGDSSGFLEKFQLTEQTAYVLKQNYTGLVLYSFTLRSMNFLCTAEKWKWRGGGYTKS